MTRALLVAAAFVATASAAAVGQTADLEVLQLRPNFYMIVGAGGNIAVQVGEDGVVLVDSGNGSRTDAVLAAIKRITPRPIRYVINTSADRDHVGGNEALAKAGETLFTGRTIGLPSEFQGSAASILATENVLKRMSAATPPPAAGALPTETFFYPRKYMFLNGEGIEILHQPNAHTDGDVVVFFRRSDVIVAGDILDTNRFPVIDVARGGSIEGEVAALGKLVDMAIPSVPIVSREAGTAIVPGHGRICDQVDAVDYRDMLSIIRDRVRDLVKAGRTLEQVKATDPTRGFKARFGSTSAPQTTDQFVEAIYRSLAPKS